MENKKRIGFAMCGSYCTYSRVFEEAERLTEKYELIPIMSENAAETDSRFGMALGNRGKSIAEYAELPAMAPQKTAFLKIACENLADATADNARYYGDEQGKQYFLAGSHLFRDIGNSGAFRLSRRSRGCTGSGAGGAGSKSRSGCAAGEEGGHAFCVHVRFSFRGLKIQLPGESFA